MIRLQRFIGLVLLLLTFLNYGMTQSSSTHKLKFLALGDSYTIGESVAEEERWPVQLVRMIRESGFDYAPPKIIATTGWRTDQLREAIDQENLDKSYDLVSLLIGVNNQYQGRSVASYEPEFENLLKTAILLAGNKPQNVIVLSIPDYGFTPFGREKQALITAQLRDYNAANKRITKKYGITYIDITPVSQRGLVEPELVATDGLHPSGKMYAEWVDLIIPALIKK